jgi:hypothetical protein
MREPQEILDLIHGAFDPDEHPGDRWLQGTFEGQEPYDEIGAFTGLHDWRTLESSFLDQHYTALSFFSEGGFRYYIPAYLVADVRNQLQTADPVFHLTHGFVDFSTAMEVDGRTFTRSSGRARLINPLRYGALTFLDYARHRLSVFCREEAAAILAYLEFALDAPWHEYSREAIERAIADFWQRRAADAPDRAALQRHNAEEQTFNDAILKRYERGSAGPDRPV